MKKVILFIATTANGFIARKDDSTPWSDDEWSAYAEMVKEAGNIVVGRKTYEIMKQDNNFDQIGNPFVVVLSQHGEHVSEDKAQCVHSTREALDLLRHKDFETVLISGGAMSLTSFLKDGLVDEIYIDMEPLLFAEGKPLLVPSSFEAQLSLLGVKQIGPNSIQLHYKVQK